MSNIRKFGDWSELRKLSKNLKSEITNANIIALKKVGLQTEREVVKYIQSQPSEWPELDKKYLKRKEKKGYSNKMLYKTGDYVGRITSYVFNPESGVFVGVKSKVVSKDDEPLVTIGHVLEYGSEKRNVKPRPHFGPVKKIMLKKIREEGLFTKYLNEALKRKYGLK